MLLSLATHPLDGVPDTNSTTLASALLPEQANSRYHANPGGAGHTRFSICGFHQNLSLVLAIRPE